MGLNKTVDYFISIVLMETLIITLIMANENNRLKEQYEQNR
jgi:hypothetical protein